MQITIDLDVENNDGTSYPIWAIVDRQKRPLALPFFNRLSAENHLEGRRYEYGDRASVYCFSGSSSKEYVDAIDKSKAQRHRAAHRLE